MRPGVNVAVKSAPPANGANASSTGVAFFAGIAERGRTDVAQLIHSMDDYKTYFGNRVSYGLLYDSCDAAFQLGATDIYVGRVVGVNATVDTHTFNDAGGLPSIAVDALGPADTNWSAAIVAGSVAGTAHIVVTDATGAQVTKSPDFAAPTDFANWSQQDLFVRVRALGANVPTVIGAQPLAGGADDRGTIDDARKIAALPGLFPKTLGIGQVAYPGATTVQFRVALANFAQDTGRVALLDGLDSNNEATVAADADAIRAYGTLNPLSETYAHMTSPWHVIPGLATGTTRTVPPSCIVAGLIAASDAKYDNPNIAAAGANGISGITLRLSQTNWTDQNVQDLNDKGVSTFRLVDGQYRLYGYRTLADQADFDSAQWDSFTAARLRMAIAADLVKIGEAYIFAQVDGKRQKIADYDGAIRGRLLQYWAKGALFGDTAAESFSVDSGPNINTANTIQNRELHARIGIKDSPYAEQIFFDVVSVPVTEGL